MSIKYLPKILALAVALTISFAAVAPISAAESAAAQPAATIPSFDKFLAAVKDGQAGVVRGVYVPGVLALRVRQQPPGDAGYVSAVRGVATQFQRAADAGVVGLLAHNYASGQSFAELAAGQEVRIAYGDGLVKRYRITEIYRFQALDPNSPYTDLVDLNTGETRSAADVFGQMYTGSDHVTFQTCIVKDGNWTWGRLFVVDTPVK